MLYFINNTKSFNQSSQPILNIHYMKHPSQSKPKMIPKIPLGKLYDAFEETKTLIHQTNNICHACTTILTKYKFQLSLNAYMLKFLRYKRNEGKFDKRNLFTAKMEQVFLGILEAFSLLSVSIPRKMFLDYVATKVVPKKNCDLSGWFQKFISRHQDRMGVKIVNGIKVDRVSKVGYEDVERFAINYEKIRVEKEINDDNIFNVDETRITINMDNYTWKAIESCSKMYYSTMRPSDYTGFTYIPFIKRNRVFMSVLILPDKKCNGKDFPLITRPKNTRKGSPILYIAYTKSGYLNGDVWCLIMSVFCKEVRKYIISSPIILLMDNLKIHTNCESLETCNKNNIIPLFFPRYSSHFLQPADDMFFLNLKRVIKEKYGKRLVTVEEKKSITLDMIDVIINIHKVISEEIIVASWNNTCLIPFDKPKMLLRAKQNCGQQDIENQSSISDIARNAAAEFIKQSKPPSPSKRTRKMELNKLFEVGEVLDDGNNIDLTTNRSKKRANSNDTSATCENVKKQKILQNKCCCQFHSEEKAVKTNFKISERQCRVCKVFIFCSTCFGDYLEVLSSHEEDCKKFTKIFSKKKQ